MSLSVDAHLVEVEVHFENQAQVVAVECDHRHVAAKHLTQAQAVFQLGQGDAVVAEVLDGLKPGCLAQLGTDLADHGVIRAAGR
jgi:hypothetical protein